MGWSDGRHQIAHLQVVHPDDRPRFRELGVAANIQAFWAAHEIHVAVNRVLPGSTTEAFLPDQRIDLATALTAYTAGSAWANGIDDTGVVRVGAYADLAVLDRDPFAHPADEIAATAVEQTFVAGARVHPAP
jgi:predicted amidohydrolase YtcJ